LSERVAIGRLLFEPALALATNGDHARDADRPGRLLCTTSGAYAFTANERPDDRGADEATHCWSVTLCLPTPAPRSGASTAAKTRLDRTGDG
jgi:hypothetical protein